VPASLNAPSRLHSISAAHAPSARTRPNLPYETSGLGVGSGGRASEGELLSEFTASLGAPEKTVKVAA
jgi:hypothetical protein